jgi:hypothetical protein
MRPLPSKAKEPFAMHYLTTVNVGDGSRLCENSEVEFANRSFHLDIVSLKNKNADDRCQEPTIEKAILCLFGERAFSHSLGQKRISFAATAMSA